VFNDEPRVAVSSFSGLLVDFCKEQNVRVIIRGLRAVSDYDYEAQIALMNRKLAPSIETFFLTAREENSYISSTMIRQIAGLGGEVAGFVPAQVDRALRAKFK
jgi:pantetheine-phosphate adenylyltransferase